MTTIITKKAVLEIDVRIADSDGTDIEIDVCEHAVDEMVPDILATVERVVRLALERRVVNEVSLFVASDLAVPTTDQATH